MVNYHLNPNWRKQIKSIFFHKICPIYVANILLIFFMISLASCSFHAYKTNSQFHVGPDTLSKLIKKDKYFILHSNNQAYSIRDLKVDSNSLHGRVDDLTERHSQNLFPKDSIDNRYSGKLRDAIVREVHLYTAGSATYKSDDSSMVQVPLAAIVRMDVYSIDQKSEKRAKVTTAIMVTIVSVGIFTGLMVMAGHSFDWTYHY